MKLFWTFLFLLSNILLSKWVGFSYTEHRDCLEYQINSFFISTFHLTGKSNLQIED